MRKIFKVLLLLSASLLIISFDPAAGYSAVSVPWSTTFNCPEWKQSDGLSATNVNCDGVTGNGSWTCSPGAYEEQITAAANYSGGGGGRGLRHWAGLGKNNNSGQVRLVEFSTPKTEVWVRWYMRYPKGFAWSPLQGDKQLFVNMDQNSSFYYGWQGDRVRIYSYDSVKDHASAAGTGWNNVMGGPTGDGLWHMYEVHFKKETDGQSNGVIQAWIDGVLLINSNTVNFGPDTLDFTSVHAIVNQDYVANSTCQPIDLDDFAISTTGYIGPVSGSSGDATPPYPPATLQAQ